MAMQFVRAGVGSVRRRIFGLATVTLIAGALVGGQSTTAARVQTTPTQPAPLAGPQEAPVVLPQHGATTATTAATGCVKVVYVLLLFSGPSNDPAYGANGCWGWDWVPGPNITPYGWTVCHPSSAFRAGNNNWVYDDTNPDHSNDLDSINTWCGSTSGSHFIAMSFATNSGICETHWKQTTYSADLHFGETYSSGHVWDYWPVFKSGPSPGIGYNCGRPMINANTTWSTSVIYNAVRTVCGDIGPQKWMGVFSLYDIRGSYEDTVISALNNCTTGVG